MQIESVSIRIMPKHHPVSLFSHAPTTAMKRAFVIILLHSLLTLGDFQRENLGETDCEYNNEIRSYFCKDVSDVFPNKFYGNYHLKCVNCNIRTFSNKTFPFTNSLVSFNVSESGIRYITPRAFSSLSNIQYIYLQNNEILEIAPGAFWGLRQVYEVHLERNHIVNIVPGIFEDFEGNSVDVSYNKIRELPNGAFEGSLSIMILDLSHNNIHTIHADSFKDLENIEILNLSYNKICNLPLGVFKHLTTVRQLDLSDNKLTKFAIGSFSGLKNVFSLNLANNSISNFDGNILLPLKVLSKLDISNNGIYYFDANTLNLNIPTMRFLRMDDNLFSCTVLMNIIQYFKKVNVDVINTVARYEVQNVNGIACTDVAITQTVNFKYFLQAAFEDSKKYALYC